MGRRRKYFTKEEKTAANRAKSKRHYEKLKEVINKLRRKIHRREMKKRRSELSSSLPVTKPPCTVKPQHPKDVWLQQVHRVQRRYQAHIGGNVLTYMQSLCRTFLETEDMDYLRDHTTALSNFQGLLYQYQSKILQLEGLGDSWVKADAIVKEICGTLSWVEEIYCAALIEPQEVRNEYEKRRFLFQRAM